MPRKSLAGSSSTPAARPKRPAPSPLSEPLARKRRRRGITPTPPAEDSESPDLNGETIVAAPVSAVLAAAAAAAGETGEVYDSEKELEAWQDFAAEHYEMVEQLPLELHRNFRLLRELDDGCIAQTKRLQALMRDYVSQRLLLLEHFKISNLPEPPSAPQAGTSSGDQPQPLESTHTNAPPHKVSADETADSADELAVDRDVAASPLPPFISGPTDVPGQADGSGPYGPSGPSGPPLPGGEMREVDGEPHPESLGVPVPDGQGGLLLPPTVNGNGGMLSAQRHGVALNEAAGRREFPPPPEDGQAQAQAQAPDLAPGVPSGHGDDGDGDREGVAVPLKQENPAEARPSPSPYLLLPEIGKMAKEIVRNGEEKVAVAVGAYNSIDRHIRALDSALSAQEASILLGLRPSTLPSLAVDEAMHLNMGEHDVHQKTEDEEVTIGLGGGRKGRKGRNDKKKKKKGEEGDGEQQGRIPGLENGGGVGGEGGAGGAGRPVGLGPTGHEDGPPFELEADPNEPRYCTCNRVSFGQMIACDNGDDCPIEWFHYGCVSLTSEPTGKWLCPVCRPRPGHHLGGHGLGSGTGTGEVKVAPKKGRVAPKGAQRRKR